MAESTRSSSSAWASAACTMPPPFRPTRVSRSRASAISTQARLRRRGRQAGRSRRRATDAARAGARRCKPDVFCFCTLPNLRTPMIRVGIESGARLIAIEKPVALTSAEGFEVRDLLGSERREGRRQPPASLRRALPEGEGDRRQRRARAASTPSTAPPPAG